MVAPYCENVAHPKKKPGPFYLRRNKQGVKAHRGVVEGLGLRGGCSQRPAPVQHQAGKAQGRKGSYMSNPKKKPEAK